VAAIVCEIASASSEQSGGIEQINKGLNQMDEITQQNSALVEQSAAAAKLLDGQATAMSAKVGMFQIATGEDRVVALKTPSAPKHVRPVPGHGGRPHGWSGRPPQPFERETAWTQNEV
jgi:methyl-accepting chemotaxis protein